MFTPHKPNKKLKPKRAPLHDLPEIGAGDTYVYDSAGRESQVERERDAADEIFGKLPAEQNATFRARWDEFEELETSEAQFVRGLDRLLPILLNYTTSGRAWLHHGISANQVRELKLPAFLPALKGAPTLQEYCEELITDAERLGFLRVESV